MPNPKIDLWCLVAICNRCGGRIVIFTNLPERLSRIEGRYSVTCTSCNHRDLFPIDRVRADTVEVEKGGKVAQIM